ncbi:hypothetical protein [Palleronia sp.]|uniref:hypothetical protein n=1 Tax=Palleronia sp. TaxID=1940284 RepID=UPI0035C7D387
MRMLVLILALMLASFAAVAAPVEHQASVEAASSHCCDTGHHSTAGCVALCALVPAPASFPEETPRRLRHPLPGDVAFTATIVSGTLDPPRFG